MHHDIRDGLFLALTAQGASAQELWSRLLARAGRRRARLWSKDGGHGELRPDPSSKSHQLRSSPLVFICEADYDGLAVGDTLWVEDLRKTLARSDRIILRSGDAAIEARHGLPPDQVKVIRAGGVANFRRANVDEGHKGTVDTPSI